MAFVVAALVSAGLSWVASSEASNAQGKADKKSAYAAYQAEKQRAWADAQLGYEQAKINAEALLAGAGAQAEGIMGAAAAQGQAAIAAGNLQAGYTEEGAMVGYEEAMKNVAMMKKENKESLRKMGEAQEDVEDTSLAKIGASGGVYTGSSKKYQETMEKEHGKQYGYAKKAGKSRVGATRSNAEALLDANMMYADALGEMGRLQAAAGMDAASAMAAAYMGGAQAQADAEMAAAQARLDATEKQYGALPDPNAPAPPQVWFNPTTPVWNRR